MITDIWKKGYLLNVTEGIQVRDKVGKEGIPQARDRIKIHADKVIGSMKLQEEMGRYLSTEI